MRQMRNKHYSIEDFSQAIQKAEEFKGGFDRISDSVLITDEDGVILYANDATFENTGFAREDVLGRTPGELWGNQKDDSFYEYMWETIKIDKKPFETVMTNKRKDGTYYGCNLKIYPILDDNEEITFFVGITSNFTETI